MSGLLTQSLRRPAAPGPVARIPEFLMTAVENVLSKAWHILLEDVRQGSFSICDSTEDQITERFHLILGELDAVGDDAVQGLSDLQSPVREGSIRNFNGAHLDKQPDLAFRPKRGLISSGNSVPTAIFIECKPIDARHPVPSTYCREGLIRFVNGDYAWGVDRAMMVGYVRNICTLPGGLSAALGDPTMAGQMQLVEQLENSPNTNSENPVCQSRHMRLFTLPGNDGPVGPITVNHLWLHTSEPCEQSRCKNVLGPAGLYEALLRRGGKSAGACA